MKEDKPDMIDPELIAEWCKMDAAATPAPWDTYVSRTDVLPGRETREIVRPNGDLHPWNVLKVSNKCCWPPTDSDAELIPVMRNNFADLLAAAKTLQRVREALANHPRCEKHPDDDEVKCGWKRAVLDIQRALEAE